MVYSIFVPEKFAKDFRELLRKLVRLTGQSRAQVLMQALIFFYNNLSGGKNEQKDQSTN